ncbi:MAG: N-6 DNA methylase [Desulfobacteraceae bacterium]|nr:N-6 DNA methylase [Desulfobacteraceae bacterium]
MVKLSELENQRQIIQAELDKLKTQEERNIKGQFSTPNALANVILQHAAKLMPKCVKIRFLDPACGTGVFFSALINVFSSKRIEVAAGYEIDKHYGKPARELWSESILCYKLKDFTRAIPPSNEKEKFNLIICNPPYVRHHHLNNQKERLQTKALNAANMKLSGLAGLYCYFIAISHRWMKSNGIAGWLIPSEFMDVNYGQAVKHYLLNEVTLLQIHRFDPCDVQFDDAFVSSAVVWFKKKKPSEKHNVKFTYGGTIEQPAYEKKISVKILSKENKWTRFPLLKERNENQAPKLSDFFMVKRGIATGDNSFFILSRDEIENRNLPIKQFRPILPSPRYLNGTEVKTDESGNPAINNQLFVLDCKLPIDEVERLYPELYAYLQTGIESGVSNRYLCRNRKIWYAQENRSESCFYCTYIGRSNNKNRKPFRFILNHSKAIVTNSYLILYPKPQLEKDIFANPMLKKHLLMALNKITSNAMLAEGRVYGGGMYKLEPKELSNVPVISIANLLTKSPNPALLVKS